MKPVALLVPSPSPLPSRVLRDVLEDVHDRTGVRVTPVALLSSAALLPALLERSPEALAWAPSSTAFALEQDRLATPLLTVSAADSGGRSAFLVARHGIDGLTDLAGRCVGWVSRSSATGYELPRLYLESFGVEPDALFASQRFCGSHRAAAEALARGEVDVIATHSQAVRRVFERAPARILVSIGPVPADVIAAGAGVPAGVCHRLVRGLAATRLGPIDVRHAGEAHLDLYALLRRHACELEGLPRPSQQARESAAASW